ncbi:hypothetical protein DBA29_12680 [Xenophilus aerolatus]|nr:hypothetical protein [Xenophilus aerolatus]
MAGMTNIASALKAEIARVARKEIRAEIETLKKASTKQRHAIADLRREIAELQRFAKRSRSERESASAAPGSADGNRPVSMHGDGTPRRFSAARLGAHRAKLGFPAADYGKLVGVSGATIYNWEQGKGRPKPAQVQELGALKLVSPTALRERLTSST